MHRVARQIYHTLQDAEKIFLIPHRHPDGDALGSVTAFMQYLGSIKKDHLAFCVTDASSKLTFLPDANHLSTNPADWQTHQPDVVIVFDSGDLNHTGIQEHLDKLSKPPIMINFDHHVTNQGYGHHNMVMHTASSTTEVLYYFFRYNSIAIDKNIATCLLTGLMTDTDNFTNGATSIKSLAIASDLIARGGDAQLIKGWVFKDKSIHSLKLWGAVLSRFTKHEKLDIVYSHLTLADLAKYSVSDEEADGIANFTNNLGEGRAALILKELPEGKVKGSFRTTRDDTDVSTWAKALGGGGHRKAAGFTVDGSIEEALKNVFATIEASEKSE